MNIIQSKPKALILGLATLALATLGASHKPSVVMAASRPAPTTMHISADNEALDFDLVNKTGYELKQVLIAPSANPQWSDDDELMQGRPFPDGSSLHITFSPKAESDHWDLKVVYSIDNTSHEWDGLNLTKITAVTLYWDADAQKTRADIS